MSVLMVVPVQLYYDAAGASGATGRRPMAKGNKRGHKAPPRARRKALAPGKTVASRSRRATLKQQLAEARAQQAATAAILKVIARSPSNVQPVFDAIAAGATRLCDASFCIVFRYDGTQIAVAADDGRSPGDLECHQGRVSGAAGKAEHRRARNTRAPRDRHHRRAEPARQCAAGETRQGNRLSQHPCRADDERRRRDRLHQRRTA